MINKIIILFTVILMAVSCSVFNNVKVGIIKTSNGGVDWQGANKIKNTENSLLERSISQMHFSSSGDKIYASSFDSGLYVSQDAGENWQEVLGGVPIYDFVFHPVNSDIMFAAALVGDVGRLLVTKDGGKSWVNTYSDAGTNNAVTVVAVNPDNASEIIIGLNKGSLIKSVDGGLSWRLLRDYESRVNQLLWRSGVLYAVVKGGGVYKSLDSGESFQSLVTADNVRTNGGTENFYSSNISEFKRLAVSTTNSSLYYLTTSSGLFKSTDGGQFWKNVEMPVRQQDTLPFAVALAPSSDSVIYVSNNSVILKSVDGGLNWIASDTGTLGTISVILINRELPQLAFAGVFK